MTSKSKTLIKTRWRNTKSWISWSKGKVSPSFSTAYVSTTSKAYAYHKRFGKPGPVTAYAGAVYLAASAPTVVPCAGPAAPPDRARCPASCSPSPRSRRRRHTF